MPAPTFAPIAFDKEDDPYDSGAGYIEKLQTLSQNFQTIATYVAETDDDVAAALVSIAASLAATVAAKNQATAVVFGGAATEIPTAGSVPVSGLDKKLNPFWLPIGRGPNKIPLNQFLGPLAYMDQLPISAYKNAVPTLVSAATIQPAAPISFVSGTVDIDNIVAPPTMTGCGQITLIPTALWGTTTAGNVALATAAVVGKALILTYDAITEKWYPSY